LALAAVANPAKQTPLFIRVMVIFGYCPVCLHGNETNKYQFMRYTFFE
jgi:hypothetical protein